MKLMPTSRCTELMTAAIANRLDEVWISPHPSLIYAYLAQYFPRLHKWYLYFELQNIMYYHRYELIFGKVPLIHQTRMLNYSYMMSFIVIAKQ